MDEWQERKDLTIRQPCAIYTNVQFGIGVSTGHFVLIRENVEIGDDVSIGSYTEIGSYVKIGAGTRIHSQCFVSEYTEIGKNVWLGPGVKIANVWHPLCPKAKQCIWRDGAIRIEDGVIIGMGAIIGPGVVIGKDAFVGMGSLVLDNVESGAVVYGNPARVKGRRCDLECKTGLIDSWGPYDVEGK